MSYVITYLQEVSRTVQAILIDARATTMPDNADGNVIKPIVDAAVAAISTNSIPYKIESDNGSLAAFFVILVDRATFTGSLQDSKIRPQFNSDSTAIDTLIADFIASEEWKIDFLIAL